ncbi:MAG: hypothetical protein Q8O40_13880 [Chloroflexota bacterium]|nr:hypothetical protein [Chloroflexota bacterium]
MKTLSVEAQAYSNVDTRPLTFSVAQVLVAVGLFYWNPVTSAWQPTVPTFNRGLLGGVRFRVTNSTGYPLYIRVESDVKKPDASSTRYVGPTYSVPTGTTQDWDLGFTADQVGTWQHNVGVYTGLTLATMNLTISQGWTNAAIVLAAAAGTISAYEFQNPATGAWQSIAPSYIVGQTLNLRAWGRNDSGASVTARMDAVVTNPAGAVSTITGPEYSLASGATSLWSFSKLLDQAGAWSVTLILYLNLP